MAERRDGQAALAAARARATALLEAWKETTEGEDRVAEARAKATYYEAFYAWERAARRARRAERRGA